jgi:predicted enzyme related to lactoylglutathione lyase
MPNEPAPGTPIWVDLSSPDVAASASFYGELLGWTAEVSPQPEAGGYTTFRSNGSRVAGAAPIMNPGQPPAWSTYVSVEDADAVAAQAKEAGGQVLVPTMDILDQGRMTVLQDPTGAVIGLWQPGAHRGADVYNVPGALCWNELSTRDVDEAERFYTAVFGWGARTSGGDGPAYTEWWLNDRAIGGMMAMPDVIPAIVPAHWLVYFAVADCEATVRRASELGGQVMVPTTTVPQGTFAILADPTGATFAVIQLNEQT